MKFQYLSSIKNITYIFLSFVLLFILKNLLFQYLFCGSIETSLMANPVDFCFFWYHKSIIAITIGLFIFLTKRYWWTAIIHFLLDIWCISNLIYYQANELLLDVNAIGMVDNMHGFWSSIRLYFEWKFLLFPILSILYIECLRYIPFPNKRYWKLSLPFLLIVVLYTPLSQYGMWHGEAFENRKIENKNTGIRYILHNYKPAYTPYHSIRFQAYVDFIHPHENPWNIDYVKHKSISQYFISAIIYHYSYQDCVKSNIVTNSLSNLDITRINEFIHNDSLSDQKPHNNLIIILVESFESWVIKDRTICNNEIMPNLFKWLDKYPTLICRNIKSQVKHGVSGDGQMIINTGILPISTGAACRLYGNNLYPNLAHSFDESITVNPTAGAWNQHVVNYSYGIKQLYEAPSLTNDESLFKEMCNHLDSISTPFYMQGITISSHSPFTGVKEEYIHLPNDFNTTLKHYLNCMSYTDKCMNNLFERFETDSVLQNSTIVITGDHTIFKKSMLDSFKPTIEKYNLKIKDGKNYTPLIIYSPNFSESKIIDEVCYQMDIYPTILNLIGCDDYYWKGFGVNVLDSLARKSRVIQENEAYELSDKIIRNNYFKTYKANYNIE